MQKNSLICYQFAVSNAVRLIDAWNITVIEHMKNEHKHKTTEKHEHVQPCFKMRTP